MRIAVIGGGVTGLTAAFYLNQSGADVVVYEKSGKVGGLAGSFQEDNWEWPLEEYFHHYFISDNHVKSLAEELNIKDKLFYKKVQTSVFSQGNIYPFDQPGDFLKFPHLDLLNKLRMGGIIFLLRLFPYLKFYDRYKAQNLFKSLVGNQGWEKVWQALMEGKFHGCTDEVSFSWLWARLKKRSPKLGYFEGGTELLVAKLAEQIKNKNKIITDTEIKKIKKDEDEWVLFSDEEKYTADKIIVAVPMPVALKLIQTWKELENKPVSKWRDLKSVGALTLVMRLEKEFLPGDTYWLNILEKDFPFLVVVEQTNFIDLKRYNGENIVYVGGYYLKDSKMFKIDKKDIFKEFSPYLRRLNPSFENYLIDYQVYKYPNAQPVIPTDYSKIKPDTTLIPNQLYWATANHIFPWDRGLNYSIEIGKETVEKIK